MVVTPTMLIVSDNQHRLIPCRRSLEGVVDIVQELLSFGYIIVGMLAVAGCSPRGLQKNVVCQRAGAGRRLKVGKLPKMILAGGLDIHNTSTGQRLRVISIYRPARTC